MPWVCGLAGGVKEIREISEPMLKERAENMVLNAGFIDGGELSRHR